MQYHTYITIAIAVVLTLQFYAVLLCDWEAASMSDKLDFLDIPTQTFMEGKDLRVVGTDWNRTFHFN